MSTQPQGKELTEEYKIYVPAHTHTHKLPGKSSREVTQGGSTRRLCPHWDSVVSWQLLESNLPLEKYCYG